MKDWTLVKAAAISGIAALIISGAVHAGPIGFSLFDPDPQPVNGTIGSSAESMRTPGGITPVQNDLTGQGYPDTSAYYNPDGQLNLPPLSPSMSDGKIYFYRHSPSKAARSTGTNTKY